MELHGEELENAVRAAVVQATGQPGTPCYYKVSGGSSVFVLNDTTRKESSVRAVVDSRARMIQLFMALGEESKPLEALRALIADPLAVERGYRIKWYLVAALEKKSDLAIMAQPLWLLEALIKGVAGIIYPGRSAAFHRKVQIAIDDPEHFLMSIFAHGLQALRDRKPAKFINRLGPVLEAANYEGTKHYPQFVMPKAFVVAERSAMKKYAQLPGEGLNLRGVVDPWWSVKRSPYEWVKRRHDLRMLSAYSKELFLDDKLRRVEFAKASKAERLAPGKKLPTYGLDFSPENVVKLISNKYKAAPLTLWRNIEAMPSKDRQKLLDQCLEIAIAGHKLYAVNTLLAKRARIIPVKEPSARFFDYVPDPRLLKRHPAFPNFTLEQLRKVGERHLSFIDKAGGDLNVTGPDGKSLAHHAVKDHGLFRALLKIKSINWQLHDNAGHRPIHYSLELGDDSDIAALAAANQIDYSDPVILENLQGHAHLKTRVNLAIGIARHKGVLPAWIGGMVASATKSLKISPADLSAVEEAVLRQSTPAALNTQEPVGVCSKCGRVAHRGPCRL